MAPWHRLFPSSDSHHAVTDGLTNSTDKSRHSEHLNRDLPGTISHLPFLLSLRASNQVMLKAPFARIGPKEAAQ
jgi:hypothetical protein